MAESEGHANQSPAPDAETSAGIIAHSLPPWDLYTVVVCLLSGYILVPLLFSNALLLINPFLGEAEQLFAQQTVTLLTWATIFGLLQAKYGRFWDCLGLKPTRSRHYYIWETLLLILLTTGLTLGLNFLWSILEQQMPGLSLGSNDPYANYSANQLAILAVFAVLVAPLLEEMIFRGFVQSTFHKVATPAWSIIYTGLVFMVLHGSYFNNVKALAHVITLGLCFGIWRERTRSLIPGVAAHLFNNGLASLMMLYAGKGG